MYAVPRQAMLMEVAQICSPFNININSMSQKVKSHLLLYGNPALNSSINSKIMLSTQNYIIQTGRFS